MNYERTCFQPSKFPKRGVWFWKLNIRRTIISNDHTKHLVKLGNIERIMSSQTLPRLRLNWNIMLEKWTEINSKQLQIRFRNSVCVTNWKLQLHSFTRLISRDKWPDTGPLKECQWMWSLERMSTTPIAPSPVYRLLTPPARCDQRNRQSSVSFERNPYSKSDAHGYFAIFWFTSFFEDVLHPHL